MKYDNTSSIIMDSTSWLYLPCNRNTCMHFKKQQFWNCYSNNLTYSHSFGTRGSTPEHISNSPYDVTFDEERCVQTVYVVDYHCIMEFTPTGKYISRFGYERSNPGQLKYPVCWVE